MTTPFIESRIEADRFRSRIDRLSEANAALHESAAPPAGPLELQAENIRLRREIEMLTALLPNLVPYEGPPPETLEEFLGLPEPHRRQIAQADPEHVEKLHEVERLMALAAQHDRQRERRRAMLEGLPVASADEFAALDDGERTRLAMTLTPAQRLAMLGETPRDPDEAYL